MLSFIALAVLLVAPTPSTAQLASSSWRKPNITTSLADRVSIAGAAIDKAASMLGNDSQFDGLAWGVAGYFYSEMADFDIATNQTKYENTLKQYFLQASQIRPNFSDELLDYGLSYGHAAARAYEAYKDPVFLDYAEQSWWFGRSYTLSSQEVSAGNSGVKDFPIEKDCQGIPMTGGTFGNTLLTDPFLTGLSSGYFLTTSALLAEATLDPMYLQAAIETASFIHSHLLNVLNEVQDTVSGRANDSCSLTSIIEPYNTGLMMEGLSVLYTISGNATIQTLLNSILTAAISSTAWQGSDGIIANGGEKTGDMNLVQGLSAVYTRNATTLELRADLEQYLAVQFNAVIDQATSNGSNIYGNSWVGPPSSIFSGTNQTNALAALIGAISLRNGTETSTVTPGPQSSPSSPEPTSPSSTPRKAMKTAAIVGGVGSFFVAAVVVVLWFLRRRHLRLRRISPQPVRQTEFSASLISPFLDRRNSSSTDPLPVRPTPHVQKQYSDWHPPMTTDQSFTTGTSRETGAVSNVEDTPRPPAIPTEELVRMLNERLQGHDWDNGEAPPEYPL
ncbi:hypothetical protein C8R45DRAFT_1015639 [Mycena sanguinolenta]|nr:hypothetical protein C8R45DRAFT_1015639 [Mycena sanguinolenta]